MSRARIQRENRELITRLRRDATHIARHFGLRFRSIEPERANVKRRYGICYSDGSIRIRLRHATTGEPLRYSSLVDTLCHELAHLRHFDHSKRFKRFYLELLAWARHQGIYRPRPSRAGARGAPPGRRVPALPAANMVAPPARREAPPHRPRTAEDRTAVTGPEQLTLF